MTTNLPEPPADKPSPYPRDVVVVKKPVRVGWLLASLGALIAVPSLAWILTGAFMAALGIVGAWIAFVAIPSVPGLMAAKAFDSWGKKTAAFILVTALAFCLYFLGSVTGS